MPDIYQEAADWLVSADHASQTDRSDQTVHAVRRGLSVFRIDFGFETTFKITPWLPILAISK